MLKNFLFATQLLFVVGCSTNFQEFLTQKEITERKYGPCNWEYVGADTDIDHPALVLKLPIINDFVLWNQKCSNLKYE
tara:strand:- start:140 stop:373 length:234 start_codon:yes stop_codon:yes gene_type:complete